MLYRAYLVLEVRWIPYIVDSFGMYVLTSLAPNQIPTASIPSTIVRFHIIRAIGPSDTCRIARLSISFGVGVRISISSSPSASDVTTRKVANGTRARTIFSAASTLRSPFVRSLTTDLPAASAATEERCTSLPIPSRMCATFASIGGDTDIYTGREQYRVIRVEVRS
jgi:hypothetical protein